jgi:hypothetical protein
MKKVINTDGVLKFDFGYNPADIYFSNFSL